MSASPSLSSAPLPSINDVKCKKCAFRGPPDAFPLNATGARNKMCTRCSEKNAKRAKATRERKKAEKSADSQVVQTAGDASPGDEQPSACDCAERDHPCARGLPRPHCIGGGPETEPMPWHAFQRLLQMNAGQRCEIITRVELEETEDTDGESIPYRALADTIVRVIRQEYGYKFNFHTGPPNGASVSRFKFYCAQRDGMQTTTQKGQPRANSDRPRGPPRATMPMERWHCDGWLSVSIPHDNPAVAAVHLYHGLGHKRYTHVEMSDKIKSLISEMQNSTASAIWKEVLRREPGTNLTQAQVYTHWASVSKMRWQLDGDQLESARQLLQQMEGGRVAQIPLEREDGVSAIAFGIPEIVDRLNTGVVEVALDSTWKTNALGWELYALLAEVNGQQMPLAFILTTSTAAALPHAKEHLLRDVFKWLETRCPNITFTHSDKDPNEINACRNRSRAARGKHQLCLYHCIEYVEKRLSQSTPPAAYDGRRAHLVFDFVDPTWGPGIDNGHADESFDGDFDINSFGPAVDDAELEDLETCLPPLFTLIVADTRVPVWPAPPKPKDLAPLPQFCPAENRAHIVAMFRKHFHLHPEIPVDEHGTRLSAEQIHRSAVHQIYSYCYERNLSQVWAYMWNRWYSPSQWVLWARASFPAIPVLKTTMIVESLWRIIKHRDLAAFNRPRIDLLIYTIVNQTLPPILHRLNEILGERRDGRPSGLTSWQKAMKAEWLELSKPDELRNLRKELAVLQKKGKGLKHAEVRADRLAELEADRARPRGKYHTDVKRWTCSCPAYLISRFLICKHLVRLANAELGSIPSDNNWFWFRLRRRRLPPFYAIPGIHDAPEPDMYHPVISAVPVANVVQQAEHVTTVVTPVSSPASTPQSTPRRAPTPLPIDEEPAQRTFMSSPERREFQADVTTVLDVLGRPQGVDPRLRKRVASAMDTISDFAGDARAAIRARTSQRTYKDSNGNTMFLD